MKKIFKINKLAEFEGDFKRLSKKFACKSLKGKGAASGIRIIYAYYEKEDIVEFVEIYYKGNKENEDRKRILKYYKSTLRI